MRKFGLYGIVACFVILGSSIYAGEKDESKFRGYSFITYIEAAFKGSEIVNPGFSKGHNSGNLFLVGIDLTAIAIQAAYKGGKYLINKLLPSLDEHEKILKLIDDAHDNKTIGSLIYLDSEGKPHTSPPRLDPLQKEKAAEKEKQLQKIIKKLKKEGAILTELYNSLDTKKVQISEEKLAEIICIAEERFLLFPYENFITIAQLKSMIESNYLQDEIKKNTIFRTPDITEFLRLNFSYESGRDFRNKLKEAGRLIAEAAGKDSDKLKEAQGLIDSVRNKLKEAGRLIAEAAGKDSDKLKEAQGLIDSVNKLLGKNGNGNENENGDNKEREAVRAAKAKEAIEKIDIRDRVRNPDNAREEVEPNAPPSYDEAVGNNAE